MALLSRVALIAGLLAAVLALVPAHALAQCPMCGKTAEYAGATPGAAYRTLAAAALFLLAPALGIMGGLGALLWRHRRSPGTSAGGSAAPGTTEPPSAASTSPATEP